MIFEKIKINGTKEYECYAISLLGDSFEVILNTADYNAVIEDLSAIEYIDILYANGALRERVTDFKDYSRISVQKDLYCDDEGNGVTTISVVFKKTSIEEKVRELDEKVNSVVDVDAMGLEEYRAYKIAQLSDECSNEIFKGLDIETTKGTKHFTYTYDDQFNVKTLFDSACMVQMDVPFHGSGNMCEIYTWQDAINIYIKLQSNLLYHTTYCNALFMHIKEDLYSKEDIASVTYGMDVPENRKTDMETALAAGEALMSAVLAKCGLAEPTPEVKEEASE